MTNNRLIKNWLTDKNKVRLLAFILGILIVFPLINMFIGDVDNVNAASTGVVSADKLNVRTGAGTNYDILVVNGAQVKLSKGTEVDILSENGTWYYISAKYNGSTIKGYVSSEYVTITKKEESNTAQKQGKVTADKLNVRTGAGTNYSILVSNSVTVRLEKDTKVTILSTDGTWYYIKATFNGKEIKGYVLSDYVEITQEPVSTSTPNNTLTEKKGVPKKIWVGSRSRNINVGEKISVAPTGFAPSNSLDEVKYWVKDTSVVEVSLDGTLIGKKIGTTLIAVYSAHDKSIKTPIEIKVGKVPKKIWVGTREKLVKLGSTISVAPIGFAPTDALSSVKYWIKDASIVSISEGGVLTNTINRTR